MSSLLLPIDSMFQNCPPVHLTPRQEKACRNGAAFSLPWRPAPTGFMALPNFWHWDSATEPS